MFGPEETNNKLHNKSFHLGCSYTQKSTTIKTTNVVSLPSCLVGFWGFHSYMCLFAFGKLFCDFTSWMMGADLSSQAQAKAQKATIVLRLIRMLTTCSSRWDVKTSWTGSVQVELRIQQLYGIVQRHNFTEYTLRTAVYSKVCCCLHHATDTLRVFHAS